MSPVTVSPTAEAVLSLLAVKPAVIGLFFVILMLVLVGCVYCVFRLFWKSGIWRVTPGGRAFVAVQALRSLTSQSRTPDTVSYEAYQLV
ncbi:envelope glycoprotein 150 [Colobine gammaherpesvirus 1]|uniref:Envelope glycoprotein 150 n=1 Tax=Colobine gammaherpesvirus 1 TaxID=2597325 RepID=A0A5B8FKD3_9GAMA|nr:envelope glycoprotein 150 [Colobine gammaherpesvirus 1]QDQ69236.1 envelope glycoprotein 150 [Colobine gammaherpesvirus 1]